MEFVFNGGLFVDHAPAANEIVPCDTLEYVEFTNTGGGMMWMAHSTHMHGRSFQILSRANINGNAANYAGVSAGFNDTGWKDTIMIWPGKRVRLLVRWSKFAGDFAYHCHLLEHEDMGMMRTIRIEACPLLGDINGDGIVDATDLTFLFSAWGTPNADLNGDGTTDSADLSVILSGRTM